MQSSNRAISIFDIIENRFQYVYIPTNKQKPSPICFDNRYSYSVSVIDSIESLVQSVEQNKHGFDARGGWRASLVFWFFLIFLGSSHLLFSPFFSLSLLLITVLRGGILNRTLRITQKPIYFDIFTNNIWSCLLWSPGDIVLVVTQIRLAHVSPSRHYGTCLGRHFFLREDSSPSFPRRLASNNNDMIYMIHRHIDISQVRYFDILKRLARYPSINSTLLRRRWGVSVSRKYSRACRWR